MPINNVDLSTSSRGTFEGIEGRLVGNLAKAANRRTGLGIDDVELVDDTRQFEVTLHIIESGKRTARTNSGDYCTSLDEALDSAKKDTSADYDLNEVRVTMKQTAKVPYFEVPVISRSLRKGSVANHHAAALRQLETTYAKRVDKQPSLVEYRVLKVQPKYRSDGNIPKGNIPKTKIKAEGKSDVSLDEALADATTRSKKVNSTIYEQTARIIIYGRPEVQLQVKDGLAAPLVSIGSGAPHVLTNPKTGSGNKYQDVTSPRGGRSGRAAMPAGHEPAYLGSAAVLM